MQYALVWRTTLTGTSVNGNPRYISTISDGNPYAGGQRASSANNGSSWTAGTSANNDNGFRVLIDTGFSPSGTFISNLKDANPGVNSVPVWGDLEWTNGALPADTNIRFQAAGSDSPYGPFDFEGPDGTPNTFFGNGASLAQFNGSRYLRYKAVLSSTNSANSPTLNDVSVCFTNQAAPNCADVSIPPLTSKTGIPLTIPVNVTDLSGRGARSADFRINFDPDIMTPVGNNANNWGVTLGTVGASNGGGRTLTVTSPTPGTLAISIFGVNDLAGAGTLVNTNFNIVGKPKESTDVSLASFVLNEGEPCSNTLNGSVTIVSGAVSGKVTFGNIGTSPFPKAVPNVNITASGSTPRSSATDTEGTYSVTDFGAGGYTVTPSKTGGDGTAVSGLDSAAIATHVVGGAQLTNNQIITADVSGNGAITSFDAALIASYSVGLEGTGSAGTWRFIPVNRTYPNIHGDSSGQDYVALLMGDVTGNWTAQLPPVNDSELAASADAIGISASRVNAGPGTTLTVPVKIGDTTGRGIQAYEFELHYDPDVLEVAEAAISLAETISVGRATAVNANEKGVLKGVVFGSYPLEGEGDLLNLHFNVIGAAGSATELKWERFRLNEGGISFKTESGRVTVASSAEKGGINGRLLDPRGGGIPRARVTLTDTRGNRRTVMTSSLGYFEVSELDLGETYTVRAESRRYRFAAQAVSITDSNAVELTMIGLE